MDWLKTFIEWAGKHLPVPITAFAILVACSGALFFSKVLGIQAEADQHRFIEMILFLGSAAVLISITGLHTWKAIALRLRRWSTVRNLSQPEIDMCQKIMAEGGYRVMDNVGNPVLVNLERLGILRDDVPPWQDRTDRPQPVTGFIMQSWARKAMERKFRSKTTQSS
jgi:hypothetical protein